MARDGNPRGLRVLCLADLHRLEYDRLAMIEQDQWIASLLQATAPNVVLIAGDVFHAHNACVRHGQARYPRTGDGRIPGGMRVAQSESRL
jgi:predicted MPP superfamily phosphohydrolase